MMTVISLVALSTALGEISQPPSWQTDYQIALAQSVRQQRPIAIFIAPGGWAKLVQEGKLSDGSRQLLADKYVPVFLNTETAEGKKLASSFELVGGIGLVLSDREGHNQAFWHDGALTAEDLTQALRKHADPAGPARLTETNSPISSSYYGPATSPAFATPVYTYPASPVCTH
jgi:hypothetical protein